MFGFSSVTVPRLKQQICRLQNRRLLYPQQMSSNKDDPLSFLNPHSSSPIPVSDGNIANYLIDHNNAQIGSASGSFQSDNLLGGVSGVDIAIAELEFGILRPDFRESTLVATVDYYQRHVFLCYKNPRNWPPRIEAAEFDRLPRLLSAAMAARKGDMKKETRLTICEGHDGTETSNGDVLIFPDMVRYRRLTHFDVDTFVEEVLIKDSEWLPGSPDKLKGFYVFVCCHGSRDRRCGTCGPLLITRFREEVELHGLLGKISVSPCSHIGGHKYAGNVIIFGSKIAGEVPGHWYGYVSPDDVPALLQQHIITGEIVEPLWRGQMGLTEEEQKKAQDLRLQSSGVNTGRSNGQSSQLNENSGPSCGINGCSQGDGKGVCCQSRVTVESKGKNIDRSESMEKKIRKLSPSNSNKGGGKRKVCSTPTWIETWEREDTYAAIAVVCAAVSVGFAYRIYKQLT